MQPGFGPFDDIVLVRPEEVTSEDRVVSPEYAVMLLKDDRKRLYWGLADDFDLPTGGSEKKRVLRALEAGQLVAVLEQRSHGAPVATPTPRALGPTDETHADSTVPYPVVLVDEHEQPLAGVPVVFSSTSEGTISRVTDGGGRAQVLLPPDASVTARVDDLAHLAEVMKAIESKPPRSLTLPSGNQWAFRTPRQLNSNPVSLVENVDTRVMIVARVDVAVVWPAGVSRDDLVVRARGGPWTFVSSTTTTLALRATGLGAQIEIVSAGSLQVPAAAPNVSFPPNPLWREPNVYIVQAGDTLDRLAETYLGDAGRVAEITGADPANAGPLTAGRELVMPAEAVPDWIHLPSIQDPEPPAPPAHLPWATIDIDGLHEGLFQGDAPALELPLYLHVPNASQYWPPPRAERVIAYTVFLEMALAGKHVQKGSESPTI